ncbi:hypothetical protein ACHAXS_013280 [Conticribra weissflogii]
MSPNRQPAVYPAIAMTAVCLVSFSHGWAPTRNPIIRQRATTTTTPLLPPSSRTVPFRHHPNGRSPRGMNSNDHVFAHVRAMSSSVTDEAPSSETNIEDIEEFPVTISSPMNATPQPPTSTATSISSSSSSTSPAAQWHKRRRKEMLQKYGDRISPLERTSSSHVLGLSLLLLSNASLFAMAYLSGKALNPVQIVLLAFFPGSVFSLWTLQILHDCLHGSLLPKPNVSSTSPTSTHQSPSKDKGTKKKKKNTKKKTKKNNKKLQNLLLFWGSMPSFFGYHLYLRHGHLSHHKSLGDPRSASLLQLFESDKSDFEDGDVLFVAHRMNLRGETGPRLRIGRKKKEDLVLSISRTGFSLWKPKRPVRNSAIFALSFALERFLLGINDVVVAITGKNHFFPNKPREFHDECARYCRCALSVRGWLWRIAGWKSLLFLFLAEVLWSIPPHPACAMFVTNHGSTMVPGDGDGDEDGNRCIPSSSTYAGKWYSVFTLGTNYHCEHHDFPTIPLHRLGKLKEIAPEYYRGGESDNVFTIMRKAFSEPEFYACMDVGVNLKNTKMLPAVAS